MTFSNPESMICSCLFAANVGKGLDSVNLDQHNQHMTWLEREAALHKLGVKAQTLYAYVSRGQISAQTHPDDPRASLYSEADIDALVKRRRRGRSRSDIASAAIAWGDPVMETRITTVRNGRLIYRGTDAVKLANHAVMEDIAALLWQCDPLIPVKADAVRDPGESGKARAFNYLARRAAENEVPVAAINDFAAYGASLLIGFADAISGRAGRGLFHQRLARFWKLDPNGADLLRRTLVLVADHELNPSSFAARVTASTGASLAACALSGFATLTGPRHGEASAKALTFLRHHVHAGSPIIRAQSENRVGEIPAVGHALYPKGDPRAKALLRWMNLDPDLKRMVKAAERFSGQPANIDMALGALCLKLGLPDDAPFLIFAAGRMVGWIAHAAEQSRSGKMIRPRAKYLGA
ncbi:MAG: citrate synthase [Pseudomonadota bacterium]